MLYIENSTRFVWHCPNANQSTWVCGFPSCVLVVYTSNTIWSFLAVGDSVPGWPFTSHACGCTSLFSWGLDWFKVNTNRPSENPVCCQDPSDILQVIHQGWTHHHLHHIILCHLTIRVNFTCVVVFFLGAPLSTHCISPGWASCCAFEITWLTLASVILALSSTCPLESHQSTFLLLASGSQCVTWFTEVGSFVDAHFMAYWSIEGSSVYLYCWAHPTLPCLLLILTAASPCSWMHPEIVA